MASAFSDSLMAWYDYEILTTCWCLYGGTKSKKNCDISNLVCKLQAKSRKSRVYAILGMLTSQNLVELSILTSEVNPENFKLRFLMHATLEILLKKNPGLVPQLNPDYCFTDLW